MAVFSYSENLRGNILLLPQLGFYKKLDFKLGLQCFELQRQFFFSQIFSPDNPMSTYALIKSSIMPLAFVFVSLLSGSIISNITSHTAMTLSSFVSAIVNRSPMFDTPVNTKALMPQATTASPECVTKMLLICFDLLPRP